MTESAHTQYLAHHLQHIHGTSEKEYARYDRYFEKNLLRYLPVERSARILDVGCGTGHFLHFLKQAGYTNYTALDCCSDALDLCVTHGFVAREGCHSGDAVAFFSHTLEQWDAVVMNDVIEHIDKAQIIDLLSAIRRALRPGGILIVKTVNAANPVLGCSSRYLDFTHTVCFTEESLAFVLRCAGFPHVALFPQNIWVFNPVVNVIGRCLHCLMTYFWRCLFLLYGRNTTHVFSKSILAVAHV